MSRRKSKPLGVSILQEMDKDKPSKVKVIDKDEFKEELYSEEASWDKEQEEIKEDTTTKEDTILHDLEGLWPYVSEWHNKNISHVKKRIESIIERYKEKYT